MFPSSKPNEQVFKHMVTLSQINKPYNLFDFNPGFKDKYVNIRFFKWESKKPKIPSQLHLASSEHLQEEAGGSLHPPLWDEGRDHLFPFFIHT